MSTQTTSTTQATQPYHLRGRFWIANEEGTFLGTGRVILLERIQEHGSISGAARSMKMSYRQAWQLVNSMNTHSTQPLVTSSTGGKGGGGASLTDTGERAIQLFREVEQDMRDFMEKRSGQITL
ncbi:winged helix-turn-helix domain-containing protein [Leucothrix pacifica]|uniref:ModE family transcriptional regulator n=1 Tax=Leucothrix pacifica TaxID=1247513 RepID=A0A317CB77_9GAMM|nr:LysR family transcriptional regulator [Leucothrix pacifica]PWQ95391.1 ModE family transcriptional regulator [Leucothrix pacifica]